MKSCLLVLLALAGSLVSVRARAADAPPPPLVDPDSEVAKRNYQIGYDLYNAGNYAAAISVFQAAYVARPSAALTYDIARSYDRMGDWAHALAHYRSFWEAAPPGQRSEALRQRIEALDARVRAAAEPYERARRRKFRIAAITVGAISLATIIAGGALYGWAKADEPARAAYCQGLPDRDCVHSELSDLYARQNASYALFAVGAVAAAADVALWTMTFVNPARERHRVWLSPTGSGVALGASF
jgi:tetratricopeptide (TPR) repeat protein